MKMLGRKSRLRRRGYRWCNSSCCAPDKRGERAIERRQWKVDWDGSGTEVHVIPVGDLLAHEDSDQCACLPWSRYDEDGGGFMVTHNAWDGRE